MPSARIFNPAQEKSSRFRVRFVRGRIAFATEGGDIIGGRRRDFTYIYRLKSMGNTCVSARGSPHAGADPSSSTGGAAAKTTKLGTIEQQQEREREEGQQQLRDIVAAADREGIALDWSALIKKAEELHHRDQELERKRRRMMQKSRSEDRGYRKRLRRKRQWTSSSSNAASDGTGACSGGGMGTGGVGSVSARFQQNIERRRRRREEAIGSFSVNLTIYRETEIPLLHDNPSFDDKLMDADPAGGSQGGTSTAASLEDTVPGLSSVDEETAGCAGSLDSSLALSDGFHIGTSFGEELETISEEV